MYDVEELHCAEAMVFCSPWTYSEGFKDRLILSLFDEDFFTDTVRMPDCERVAFTRVLQELWTIALESIFWKISTQKGSSAG